MVRKHVRRRYVTTLCMYAAYKRSRQNTRIHEYTVSHNKEIISVYISLTCPWTAIKLHAHAYYAHMRGVRDKADSCRNYRRIKDLLLFGVRIVIAYQELQRRSENVFSIIIAYAT